MVSNAGFNSKVRALLDLAIANMTWRGRASRRTLFVSIGLAYLFGAAAFPLSILQAMSPSTGLAAQLLQGLSVALGLVMAAFLMGAFVRRLHDRGKASFWLLLFLGPHAALVMLLSHIRPEGTLFNLTFFLGGMLIDFPLLLWWMAETFFLRGVSGPNRFGEDPLAAISAEQPITSSQAAPSNRASPT